MSDLLIDTVTWNGEQYPVRELTIFRGTPDELNILVSVLRLEDKLIDKDTGTPFSHESYEFDSNFYFYLDDEEILLPDEEIISIMGDD